MLHEFNFIKNIGNRTDFVVYAQDWNENRSEVKSYMFVCFTKTDRMALLITSALQNYDKTENREYVFDKTIK